MSRFVDALGGVPRVEVEGRSPAPHNANHRVNRQNGSLFWGCLDYPNCKFTRPKDGAQAAPRAPRAADGGATGSGKGNAPGSTQKGSGGGSGGGHGGGPKHSHGGGHRDKGNAGNHRGAGRQSTANASERKGGR